MAGAIVQDDASGGARPRERRHLRQFDPPRARSSVVVGPEVYYPFHTSAALSKRAAPATMTTSGRGSYRTVRWFFFFFGATSWSIVDSTCFFSSKYVPYGAGRFALAPTNHTIGANPPHRLYFTRRPLQA